jgi:hypothetical protein
MLLDAGAAAAAPLLCALNARKAACAWSSGTPVAGGWPGAVEAPGMTLSVVGTPAGTLPSAGFRDWAPADATLSRLTAEAITRLATNRARARRRGMFHFIFEMSPCVGSSSCSGPGGSLK